MQRILIGELVLCTFCAMNMFFLLIEENVFSLLGTYDQRFYLGDKFLYANYFSKWNVISERMTPDLTIL